MSSIENRDLKSLAEIEALGGEKADLPHDTKIYVTAKGLNKTLAEIIESGEIADGNRFGADVKAFAMSLGDGSAEEYNTEKPFLNGDGNTQLNLSFEIKDFEVAQLYVDGKYITKFVSGAVSKNTWWKIVNDTAIEIQGDFTQTPVDISFIVYRGSEIPVVPSVFSGLKIENEAFGYTDSPNGDNIEDVRLRDGVTEIQFSFNFLQNAVICLYVDGELWPTFSPSNQTNKWFRKSSANSIVLPQDLSQSNTPFYVAVYQGKSFVDSFGNMVVTLKPEIASFILQSEDGNKWQVSSNIDGSIGIDSIVTVEPADRILFRRDDGTIVELYIENEGDLSVDLPNGIGIMFETIYLASLDGTVREFKALEDNTPYTNSFDGSFSELRRPNGNVIKKVMASTGNAVYESTGYVEEDELEPLNNEPNKTITETVVRLKNGNFTRMVWDTLAQKWSQMLLSMSAPYGVAVDFYGLKEAIPKNFRIANGDYVLKSEASLLYSIIGTHYGESVDGLSFRLPDLRGTVSRGVDDNKGYDLNQRILPNGELAVRGDDTVGSYQTDKTGRHYHNVSTLAEYGEGNGLKNASFTAGGSNWAASFYSYFANERPFYYDEGYKAQYMENDDYNSDRNHGKETTMKNVACYKIMKIN